MARMTIGELAVKMEGNHELLMQSQAAIKADVQEIKENGHATHDTLVAHGERISKVEGKQSLLSKIIFLVLSGGGLSGAGLGLFQLLK